MMTELELNELCITHYDQIKGYVETMLRNREDAEDVTQEVFVSMAENYPNIDRPLAYAYRVAYTKAIDHIRDPLNHAKHNDKDDKEELPEYLDYSELREAITHLPATYSTVIYLHYWKEMKYNEIAAELGITLKAVECIAARAKDKLRKELRGNG